MDRLYAMKVFTKVVETGGFTRAVQLLDLPPASATRIIQQLEAHLKVRLLQRTTRRLNLTAEGAAYYELCLRILADIEEAENSLAHGGRAPRGKLRVDMPGLLGKMIVVPKLHEFHALYPGIDLMLGFGDRPVDLIQEGVDCVIRIGTLRDSSLLARRIGVYQGVTVASQDYLDRYGVPATPEDLERHVAANYFWGRTGRIMELTFEVDGHPVEVRMKGWIAVNDAVAYVDSGVEGIGIIQAARFMVLPHMKSGKLVEILSQWKPLPMPISAVYPHNRHLSPPVRVFVDWVANLFSECELLSDQADSEARCPPSNLCNADVSNSLTSATGAAEPIA